MSSSSNSHVIELLSRIPLPAVQVPQDAVRRCDLRAVTDTETYLLEVKDRGLPEEFEAQLRLGDFPAPLTENLGNTNRLNQLIRHAITQLDSTATSLSDYKLVWMVSRHALRHETVHMILLKALLGLQELIIGSNRSNLVTKSCLYFGHSIFHRFPQLNGFVLEANDLRTLYVNEFAVTHSDFLQGSLCQRFCSIGTVADPRQMALENDWLVADTAIDRTDASAMQAHLKSKYGLRRADPIDLTRCIVCVPTHATDPNTRTPPGDTPNCCTENQVVTRPRASSQRNPRKPPNDPHKHD